MTYPDEPVSLSVDEDGFRQGLTKREYFAAQAMVGVLARNSAPSHEKDVARMAVKMADALIEELNKE